MKPYKLKILELEKKVKALETALYKGVMPFLETPEFSKLRKNSNLNARPIFNEAELSKKTHEGASEESEENSFLSPLISD